MGPLRPEGRWQGRPGREGGSGKAVRSGPHGTCWGGGPVGSGQGGVGGGCRSGRRPAGGTKGPCEGHILWLQGEENVPGLGRGVSKAMAPCFHLPHQVDPDSPDSTPPGQNPQRTELCEGRGGGGGEAGGPQSRGAEGGRCRLPDRVGKTAVGPAAPSPFAPAAFRKFHKAGGSEQREWTRSRRLASLRSRGSGLAPRAVGWGLLRAPSRPHRRLAPPGLRGL